MLRRKARAGVYAERRYRRGLRRWRARIRPALVAGFGPFIAAGLAVFFLSGHRFVWFAGLVTGLFVGAWIAFRDSPPRYVESWHDGAEGERKTEKALRPLERGGWRTFHDLQARYGNYDHITVGPAGVFLLESKNLMGTVELRDGMPYLQRRLDPEAKMPFERIRPQALAAAARLKEEIERRTGERTWVQAVVVFWSEFPQGVVDDGRCVFLHGSKLRGWMEGRPARLSEAGVEAIAVGVARVADGEAFVEASAVRA